MRIGNFAWIALAALLSTAAHAQSARKPYKAHGNEPFWALTLDGRTMRFEAPDKPALTVASPRPIVGFNGERYETAQMIVEVTHVPCSDGMSDWTYADTVQVRVGMTWYRGCGGERVNGKTSASLLEGAWNIVALDGRPVSGETHPDITFRGTRMSGDASCNRFSGNFRFARGQLTAGPIASTRRMCAKRIQNTQESAILGRLGERLRVSSYRDKLVLTARSGRTLVLERATKR